MDRPRSEVSRLVLPASDVRASGGTARAADFGRADVVGTAAGGAINEGELTTARPDNRGRDDRGGGPRCAAVIGLADTCFIERDVSVCHVVIGKTGRWPIGLPKGRISGRSPSALPLPLSTRSNSSFSPAGFLPDTAIEDPHIHPMTRFIVLGAGTVLADPNVVLLGVEKGIEATLASLLGDSSSVFSVEEVDLVANRRSRA